MFARPKDDKGAIHHWFTLMHFEWGKRKYLIFPNSLWNGIGQKHTYHYGCKVKRRQTRYIPMIYLHAFRIRKQEISPFSLFTMERRSTEKHYASMWDQKTTKALYSIKRLWTKKKKHTSFQRRQTRYIPLIYLHVFRIRKKRKRLLFPYSIWNGDWQKKTYTIMLVRPKDDKLAIYHWSTFMLFE